ncbi:MAG: Y-family DNA polymerase [Chitinophagaceae bacterium]|nr:MAG: Y-family DNA polymerase [Chitinophagaceae bacterium]
MYALVDCNNFYCSCERLFDPRLEKAAIIVLSNNDGCAISRSEEAKVLGIDMGTPAFMIQSLINSGKVKVFSSNYTLYGDMSDRVMKTLGTFVPSMEIYSIDEAFLDMHDMHYSDLLKLGVEIRRTIKRNIGIPVTVGIAATKTLAKMANRFAKKKGKDPGVYWAANNDLVEEMLRATAVNDVWGIGHSHALLLKKNGIHTAYEFMELPEEWVRVNMSVIGQRLLNEVRGIPAIQWEFETPAKQNICTSRSFGTLLTDPSIIKEAICNHAATCAAKLRQQKSCCRNIHIFIQTNLHKMFDAQYSRSVNVELETASNDTGEIIKAASRGFDMIFKEGYRYMKCGVIVCDLLPEESIQRSMFDTSNKVKSKLAMTALDNINKSLGKEIVRFAVQGYEKKYRLKAAHLSKKYTTNFEQLLKVEN